MAQAKGSLAQSQAALLYAKQDFSFVDKLQGTNAVSQETYEQKKNAVDIDVAQVQASEAAVQASQVNVDYCSIYSPINGRAGNGWSTSGTSSPQRGRGTEPAC